MSDKPESLVEHFKETCDLEPVTVSQLLEKTPERNGDDEISGMMRIDLMKVSSLEIIITFYMATHMPLQDVSKFVLSEE